MAPQGPGGIRKRIEPLLEIALALDFLGFQVAATLLGSFPSFADPLASVKALVATIFISASLVILTIHLLQRRRGETIASLGFGAPQGRRREAILGLLLVPLIFLFTALCKVAFRRFAPGWYSGPRNVLEELMQTPLDLFLLLLAVLFAGGIKEEIQRAFIIRRFEAGFGRPEWAALLYAVAFGYGHRVQGWDEAVIAGAFGLLWGILYLRRRSLVIPMVSHGGYDAVEVIRYYFFGPLIGS